MALMDNLLNAATKMLGGNSENGAQGSLTDMAMDLVKQQGGVGNLIRQKYCLTWSIKPRLTARLKMRMVSAWTTSLLCC